MKGLLLTAGLAIMLGLWFATARAESAPDRDESPKVAKQKSKGKRSGEKEAEGTQAANRFQADTVIKSKYELNGEPLEVDPD